MSTINTPPGFSSRRIASVNDNLHSGTTPIPKGSSLNTWVNRSDETDSIVAVENTQRVNGQKRKKCARESERVTVLEQQLQQKTAEHLYLVQEVDRLKQTNVALEIEMVGLKQKNVCLEADIHKSLEDANSKINQLTHTHKTELDGVLQKNGELRLKLHELEEHIALNSRKQSRKKRALRKLESNLLSPKMTRSSRSRGTDH